MPLRNKSLAARLSQHRLGEQPTASQYGHKGIPASLNSASRNWCRHLHTDRVVHGAHKCYLALRVTKPAKYGVSNCIRSR